MCICVRFIGGPVQSGAVAGGVAAGCVLEQVHEVEHVGEPARIAAVRHWLHRLSIECSNRQSARWNGRPRMAHSPARPHLLIQGQVGPLQSIP